MLPLLSKWVEIPTFFEPKDKGASSSRIKKMRKLLWSRK